MRNMLFTLVVGATVATATLSTAVTHANAAEMTARVARPIQLPQATVYVAPARRVYVAPPPRAYVAPGVVVAGSNCVTRTVCVATPGGFVYRTVRRCF